MPNLRYMAKKYANAIHTMAVREGTLRERVRDAYVGSARYAHYVRGDGLGLQPSSALVERIDRLHERVTKGGYYETGFVELSDKEIAQVAEEIFAVSAVVTRELRALEQEWAADGVTRHQRGDP